MLTVFIVKPTGRHFKVSACCIIISVFVFYRKRLIKNLILQSQLISFFNFCKRFLIRQSTLRDNNINAVVGFLIGNELT